MTKFTGIETLSDEQLHQLYGAAVYRMDNKDIKCPLCAIHRCLCKSNDCAAQIVYSSGVVNEDAEYPVCNDYCYSCDHDDWRDSHIHTDTETFLSDLADALEADAIRRRGNIAWLGVRYG